VAGTLNNLGLLWHDKNEFEKAEKSFEEALNIRRKLAQANPQTYLPDVAGTLNNLGLLRHDKNKFEKAEKPYQEALKIYRKLTQVNPQTHLPDIGMTLNNLANLQRDKNEFEEAEKSYQEALKIYRKLAINMGIFYRESKINKELSIQFADEAITNMLLLPETPQIQNYLELSFNILRGWNIDVDKYLEEKLKDNT